MMKLIGVSSLKKTKKQPATDVPRNHRADDDMDAYLSQPPRTPNGATDLLSGRDNDPPPSSLVLVDYDDDDDVDGIVTPPTSHLFSNGVLVENDEEDGNDSDGFGSDIYAQLNSFEEKLENELMDLEKFGVNAGAAPRSKTTTTKTKGQDPDGRGERGSPHPMSTIISGTASPVTASLFKKGNGKSGKNLAMLSGKTSKIMTDYQAYLAEIKNAFPLSADDDDDDGEEMVNSPALVSIKQVRDDIRYSYEDQHFAAAEEGGGGGDEWITSPSSKAVERDDNYATGGGERLCRAWSHERNARYDMTGDGMRYAHTWISSRRAKRGIGMIALAVAVVIGVSVAIANSKKSDSLPNLKAEYIAEIEKVEEEYIAETEKEEEKKRDDNNIHGQKILNPLLISSPNNQAGDEPSGLYYNAAMRYQPVMYDRSKGWMGQTYIEALVFCEETAGLAVCPYDAVCPSGIDSEPLGGYRDSPSGDWAWIPIVDDHNEWVQAGAREKCNKFSDMHGESPEWGMTGEGNRDSTENVMCCLNVM